MKIVAIHAHPDDVEFLCAGTLAHLVERGHAVAIATMTAGDKGSASLSSSEIAAIRKQEAANAASILGQSVSYTCLGFRDVELFDDHASRQVVTAYLRREAPDIVLAASPQDYMCDHEAASALVRNACFLAGVPLYETPSDPTAPCMSRIPALYYMDPIEGIDMWGKPVIPDFGVDLNQQVLDTKRRMLECHASQRDWLRSHHGVDEYVDSMHSWVQRRGALWGVSAAEGFRQHRGHAYPHQNVLQQLLEDVVLGCSPKEAEHV
jgi:LmbE family N-acetylglucosaminyl deacetylase